MNLQQAIQNPIFSIIREKTAQPTFVIGGFVRDYLLQRESTNKDIDIVTEGNGMQLAENIAQTLQPKPKVTFFKRFGTAMFKYKGIEYEFVGARKESYTEDSRKPNVELGSIEDDQWRRDFTINTLAISLNTKDFGMLVDPFYGLADLQNKIIRTPLDPQKTFSDDPLRMLRAIRFACQLDFRIDKKTFEGIQKSAYRIEIISQERIAEELHKIMLTDKPSLGFKLLNDTGLLSIILPEITDLQGIEEVEGKTHKDNFYHTLEVVDNISKATQNLWLRYAALFHDIGKAKTKKYLPEIGWSFHSHEFVGSKMVVKIFQRLRLSVDKAKYVAKIVRLSSRPIPLISDETSDAALRRLLFETGNDLEDLFTLCKADITTKNDSKLKQFQKNFEKVEQKIKEVEERDKIRNFQPPITGEEIMYLFDLKPCKEVGILKESIKEAILEGKIRNEKKNSLEFVVEIGKSLNLTPKNHLAI